MFRRFFPRAKRARRGPRTRSQYVFRRKPLVELLEERRMLAAVIVGNDNDEVNGSVTSIADLIATPGADGISLREAIQAANADAAPDVIIFDPSLSGGQILLNVADGQLNVTNPVTIDATALASRLTINANDPSTAAGDGIRIFEIQDGTTAQIAVTLKGLRLINGDAGASGGGAVLSFENLTITNCIISDNSAGGGGGLAAESGTTTISDSTISNNRGGSGGGIHARNGVMNIVSTTISGNSGIGGGIQATSNNTTIISNTISGNSSTGSAGGIRASNGTLTIINSTISGNRANLEGGGIHSTLAASDILTIRHSTIALNVANADNNGSGTGGGIYLGSGEGTVTLENSTIADNIADITGPDIDNTTAAVPHPTINQSFTLIGNNSGSGLAPSALIGTSGAVIDPMLGPLANNGGPTLTHALLVTSPAIDAGDPTAVAGMGGTPEFDQRGEPFVRVFDGDLVPGARIDIGAYERQSFAAQTLVVDTLLDESDGNYSAGDISLREAIGLANGNVGVPETIAFAASLTSGGPATILLTMGELVINDALTIEGPGAVLLTIDAQQMSRIFDITATTGEFTMNGLTLTGGKTTGDNAGVFDSTFSGGAIRSLSTGNLTIAASTISDSYTQGAYAHGAAIFAYGDVILTGSTISRNHTDGTGAVGGGVNAFFVTLTNSTISGNYTTEAEAHGGGVQAFSVTLNNSIISGNYTTGDGAQGGGIRALNAILINSTVSGNYTTGANANGGGIHANGYVTLTNSTVSGNRTQGLGTDGGGVFVAGALTVTTSTISGNSANIGSGGGLFLVTGSASSISGSTISDNYASAGGGIYSNTTLTAALTITNSTISGNMASGVGGGVFNTDGLTIIEFSTITDNNVTDGLGAVASIGNADTTTQVRSSIIAGNMSGDVHIQGATNSFQSEGFNLVGSGTAIGAFTATGDQTAIADPMLFQLADNGGPTQTHKLRPTSPAIDAGDPAAVAGMDGVPEFDQRGTGFPRVLNGDGLGTARIDIGAFEAPTVTIVAPRVTLDAGMLVITDLVTGGANDEITLRVEGNMLVIIDPDGGLTTDIPGSTGNGTGRLSIPVAKITGGKVVVNTLAGNDMLTVDFGTASSFPVDVEFNGGEPSTAPGDKLVVTGGTFARAVHTLTGGGPSHSGRIVYEEGSEATNVAYTGLEPVDMTGSMIANLVFNLPGTGDMAILEDDGTAGNDFSQIRSVAGTFETTTFSNVGLVSLTINMGADAGTLTVDDLPDFTRSLTIDGQAGADTVTFQGTVDLSSAGADLDVQGAEDINDAASAILMVDDAATFNAGTGPITLADNAADVLEVGGLATFSTTGNVDVGSAGTVNFAALDVTGASVTIVEDSASFLTAVTATTFSLTSNGAISDAPGTTIAVSGLATFDAGANLVVLGNLAGDTTNFGSLAVTGAAVNITEDSAMVLTALAATGAANMEAAGALRITGNVSVGANSTFTAVDSAAAGDDLTIVDGATIDGNTNDLTFNAGDDFLFAAGAMIVDADMVVVNADMLPDPDAPDMGSSVMFLGSIVATQLTLNGGEDNDTFTVVPSADTPIKVNGGPPADGEPGVPPGDRLFVSDTFFNADLSAATLPDGMITFFGGNPQPIEYTGIEGLLVIGPDFLEDNDTRATATFFGSQPVVTLDFPSIDDADDEDFFKITAHDTGKLIVRALFDHDVGNLDLEIQDRFGNVIAMANSMDNDEELIIPVVGQQMYFIRVFGVAGAINNYDLEIENFAAPVPTEVKLHPADDNGASSFDNATSVIDPDILIQADLTDFAAMGIPILTSAMAAAGMSPGAAVEVFVNGVSQGFANSFPVFNNTLFGFELSSGILQNGFPINGGVLNLVTAAVRIFDGQGNAGGAPAPASGRTQLSVPLNLRTIDTDAPRIVDISIPGSPDFDLFDPKPTEGPTPLVESLLIEFSPSYDVSPNVTVPYEDISATGTEIIWPNNDDDDFVEIPIGFTFPFFDGMFSQVFVATNGLLTFGSGNSLADNQDLTVADTEPSQPAIAPLWDDWDINSAFAGRVYHELRGAAGVDLRLIVQWHDVEHFVANGVDGTVDFEVVLFENGTIEFRYNDVITGDAAEDFGASATVGIRDAEPTAVADGEVHQISFNQAVIGNGRTIRFSSPFDSAAVTNPANYSLVGAATGPVLIESVTFLAPNKVRLNFAEPLADDRFTLTVFDSIQDLAGNLLDGEPGGFVILPSGNGIPGGDFVVQFTVDSRPEIGVWAAGTVLIDANGNFLPGAFGPHGDLAFHLGFASDYVFAGNFASDGPDDMFGTPDDTTMAAGDGLADDFDKLAAYGRVGNQFRWMIDVTNDGVPDFSINDPANINGIPVAGNFDGIVENGDEVGIFTGTAWHLDTNHDFRVDRMITATYSGFPIVGNFDGLPGDDLGTYVASHTGNRFFIDLNTAAMGSPITTDGAANTNFGIGVPALAGGAGFFGFPGVRERPVAADMNRDGVDDIGLWVPDGTALVPDEMGEWFFLVSDNDPMTPMPENTIINRIAGGFVSFTPTPFANDLYAQFGNSFALPVVGNFDPPPVGGPAAPAVSTVSTPTRTPPPSSATPPAAAATMGPVATTNTSSASATTPKIASTAAVTQAQPVITPAAVDTKMVEPAAASTVATPATVTAKQTAGLPPAAAPTTSTPPAATIGPKLNSEETAKAPAVASPPTSIANAPSAAPVSAAPKAASEPPKAAVQPTIAAASTTVPKPAPVTSQPVTQITTVTATSVPPAKSFATPALLTPVPATSPAPVGIDTKETLPVPRVATVAPANAVAQPEPEYVPDAPAIPASIDTKEAPPIIVPEVVAQANIAAALPAKTDLAEIVESEVPAAPLPFVEVEVSAPAADKPPVDRVQVTSPIATIDDPKQAAAEQVVTPAAAEQIVEPAMAEPGLEVVPQIVEAVVEVKEVPPIDDVSPELIAEPPPSPEKPALMADTAAMPEAIATEPVVSTVDEPVAMIDQPLGSESDATSTDVEANVTIEMPPAAVEALTIVETPPVVEVLPIVEAPPIVETPPAVIVMAPADVAPSVMAIADPSIAELAPVVEATATNPRLLKTAESKVSGAATVTAVVSTPRTPLASIARHLAAKPAAPGIVPKLAAATAESAAAQITTRGEAKVQSWQSAERERPAGRSIARSRQAAEINPVAADVAMSELLLAVGRKWNQTENASSSDFAKHADEADDWFADEAANDLALEVF